MQSLVESGEEVVTAAIAYVEMRAALAAARRDGRLSEPDRGSARADLEELWADIVVIPIDSPLLRAAGDVAERLRLRAYDAVHLAALTQAGSTQEISFACWDNQLRRAAQQLGYTLVPA